MKDERYGLLCSNPIAVPMFSGQKCRIFLEGYAEDEHKEDFHVAISNFLAGTPAVLRDVDEPLLRYYQDSTSLREQVGKQPSVDELWRHVRFGSEVIVTRRPGGDKSIYISIECSCDWEVEHGLQLVLKNGSKVNKLGGYDGHLTNSDAFGDPTLENVVYR